MIISPHAISNDPLMGLKRKGVFVALEDKGANGEDALMIHFMIRFYDEDDNEIINNRVRPYAVTLRADNSTPVNAQGQYVLNEDGLPDWEDDSVVCGEYDFLEAAIGAGANIRDMIIGGLLRADGYGRFNV